MSVKKSVLITGCSDGGSGSALALQFHRSGYRVFATARNLSKLHETEAVGTESIQLDVTSQESLKQCVATVSERTGGGLHVLVNNAGAGYSMPLLDFDMDEVRKLFELNVFSTCGLTNGYIK
jgi:1-acylglycerone phosphate reductase